MKRTITVILVAAMLLSFFSMTAFAATTVTIDFTLPSVGDKMHVYNDSIDATVDGVSTLCTVHSVYTGDDITAILNAKQNNDLTTLKAYTNKVSSPSETYNCQDYLIIVNLFSQTANFNDSPVFSSKDDNITSDTLYTDSTNFGTTLYAYLKFEPKESSEENNETENTPNSETTSSKNVLVSYDDSNITKEIISVDFTWDELKFTYTPETKGTWNPSTHQYDNAKTAAWSSETNGITVTNHSNTAINAVFSYTPAEGFSGITASFVDLNNTKYENQTVTIATAENTTRDNAPNKTVYILLDGDLADNTIDNSVSGTVTITIQ